MPVKITSGNSYVSASIGISSDAMTGQYARGYVVFAHSNDHEVKSGYKPITSDRNYLGERSCVHQHLEGELIATNYEFHETTRSIMGRTYYDSWLQPKNSSTKVLVDGAYYPSKGITFGLKVNPTPKTPTNPMDWRFKTGNLTLQVSEDGGSLTGSLIFVSPFGSNVSPGAGAVRDVPSTITLSVNETIPLGRYVSIQKTSGFDRQTWDWPNGHWVSHPQTFGLYLSASVSKPCKAVAPTDTGVLLAQTVGLVNSFFLNAEIETTAWQVQQETLPSLVSGALDAAADLSINTLAYARDVRNLAKDAKSLLKTARGIKNPKNWANAWLSYRFGLRLFAQDTKQVLKAIQKIDTYRGEIRRSHRSQTVHRSLSCGETDVRTGLTLFVDAVPMRQRSISHAALALDVAPTLSNMWDFLPYSFVVDWLVPVGEALETIDSKTKLSQFPVRGATITTRADVDIGPPPDCTGNLHLISFKREFVDAGTLSRRLQPFKAISNGLGDGVSLKHMIDFVCLAVQRLR